MLAQGHREEVAKIRAHISVILKLMLLGIPRSLYVFVTIFMCLFLAVLGRGRCGVAAGSLVWVSRGYALAAVLGLLVAVTSFAVEPGF